MPGALGIARNGPVTGGIGDARVLGEATRLRCKRERDSNAPSCSFDDGADYDETD